LYKWASRCREKKMSSLSARIRYHRPLAYIIQLHHLHRALAKMLRTSIALPLLLASGILANPQHRNDQDLDADIFPSFDCYSNWAICKGEITKAHFPTLNAPDDGGCVRYFQGIDMTGVVTELHFFFKDGFRTACDCAAKCLEQSSSCTNWVWKHAFMPNDDGKRSCTLYSSPILPSNVTLAYDTAKSVGFMPLDPMNNPQVGSPAPLTFLDEAMTKPDEFGVSGFLVQDQNGRLFC
ncbi:hypothetical protein V2G26_019934, partial [Clonostachys chloroleuca]